MIRDSLIGGIYNTICSLAASKAYKITEVGSYVEDI